MAEQNRVGIVTEDVPDPNYAGLIWDPVAGLQQVNLDGSISSVPTGLAITPQVTPTPLTDSTGGAADATLDANPTVLTDSTGGAPASTLVVVRSDTGAHTAADAIANFASLNAQLNADVVVLRDNIASLNAQLNAVVEAVQDAGIFT